MPDHLLIFSLFPSSLSAYLDCSEGFGLEKAIEKVVIRHESMKPMVSWTAGTKYHKLPRSSIIHTVLSVNMQAILIPLSASTLE